MEILMISFTVTAIAYIYNALVNYGYKNNLIKNKK